jgi:hypothetical protein
MNPARPVLKSSSKDQSIDAKLQSQSSVENMHFFSGPETVGVHCGLR